MNRNALAASRDGEAMMQNGGVTGAVDEILTTGDAAILCGVSRSTLRRAVAQGHLRAWHTPGKHLRFSRAGCLAFAASLGQVDLVGRPYREAALSLSGAPARAVEA